LTFDLTIVDLAKLLRAGERTAAAVVEECLRTIQARDAGLNAFITVLADEAREQARAADRELASGHDRGPLHGVPISLKDLIDLRGTPTTAASRVRAGHVASQDAPIVSRLKDAGAIVVGKTNLHEFALGTTNEDSAFGPVHHPLDLTRSPGGSSGGSAVSVLAGMAWASVGTDTGGSIRIPSAACGLVGLKPTFGEVPTEGVVPLSSTLDHVGPICRSVEDAFLMYAVLGGKTAAPRPRRTQGLTLGVPREYFLSVLDHEVASAFDVACERLREAGVRLEDVVIPHAAEIATTYLHIALPEAAAYHAPTLDSRPDDYTANVRARLEMARSITAEDYARALRGRETLRAEVDTALEVHDALLLPSLAVPATKLGADSVRVGDSDQPVRSITLRLTQLFNITGHPAITVPCGAASAGLPVGAQLVGRSGRTGDLLAIAAALEPRLRGDSGART
jgi:aspartyl-tRNA(Asn)/glutamyl-tRNA(Gln) amidotransferase subunit A